MNCGQVMWWMEQAAKAKDAGRNMGYPIDEVAIAFPNPEALDEFLRSARDCGLDNFRNVNDTVYAQDPRKGTSGSYMVSYRFLRLPGADWRVEAMHARSSLHRSLFRNEQVPVVVHASYKCFSMSEFMHAMAEANKKGFGEEMFCASGYGLFSYRRPLVNDWPLKRTYLKPRLPWTSVVTAGPLP